MTGFIPTMYVEKTMAENREKRQNSFRRNEFRRNYYEAETEGGFGFILNEEIENIRHKHYNI